MFWKRPKPMVIVRVHDGCEEVVFNGDVEVYYIDERSKSDRVYQMTVQTPRASMLEIIGDSPIGHAGDDRHPGIAARIFELLDGKPRLTVVKNDEP